MSLFTKAIGDIALADVEAFCQQGIVENVRVEYKRELSGNSERKQVAKEVAAMANTLGGIIIFGVEEDRATHKPQMPLVGLDAQGDPAARIKSICLDAIYPPIEPEVQTCKLADGRVVIVVRVHESEETPHSIEGRTEWYVRADDRCAPRPATEEELDLLRNRRAKLEDRRNRLIDRCEQRFNSLPNRNMHRATLQIVSVPRFPSRELLTLKDLDEMRLNASGGNFGNSSAPFGVGSPHAVHGGLMFRASESRTAAAVHEVFSLGQVDLFGTIAFGYALEPVADDGKIGVNLNHIMIILWDYLSQLRNFNKKFGYWGPVDFRLSLRKTHKMGLGLIFGGFGRHIHGAMDFEQGLDLSRTVSVDQLAESFKPLMIEIVREILWAFGVTEHTLDDEFMMKLVDKTEKDRR